MFIDTSAPMDSRVDAPIPGQGLTSDPNSPQKWETPPEYTDVNEALVSMVHPLVTQEEPLREFLRLAEGGLPLEFFVQMMTFRGFKEGKWTPDLMLLLQEPLLYYMIAICEQAQIAYNLDEDDMKKTMEDTSYRYSSDPEFEDEVVAITEEKIPEQVDMSLLSNVEEMI